MNKSFFFLITTIIFGAVSILHFLRLTFELEILINSRLVPGWVSGLAVIVGAIMAYWAFELNRKRGEEAKEKDIEKQ